MIFPKLPYTVTKPLAIAFVILAPASGVFAEPSESDILAGLNDYLDRRNAQVEDFDFKLFEGTEAGEGRVAVEGTLEYREPLGRRTSRYAFYPDVENRVRNRLLKAAGIPYVGAIWERVVKAGEPIAFSGSMDFTEGVSSFDWNISLDIDLPERTSILGGDQIGGESRLPEGHYIEPSDRYEKAKQTVRQFEKRTRRIQENFVTQIGEGIAGKTFHHTNQCDDTIHYEIHFDEEPVGSELGGAEDMFQVDVMLGGELIFRNLDLFHRSWHEAGERQEFRRPITLKLLYDVFTEETQWAVMLDREWFYRDGSEFKETATYRFQGYWKHHMGDDGFFPPKTNNECATTAIIRQ